MTKIKISSLKTFDAADFLSNAESRVAFLDLVLRSGDINDIADSLNIIARSCGRQELSVPPNSPQQAQRTLPKVGRHPRLSDLLAITQMIGAELRACSPKTP